MLAAAHRMLTGMGCRSIHLAFASIVEQLEASSCHAQHQVTLLAMPSLQRCRFMGCHLDRPIIEFGSRPPKSRFSLARDTSRYMPRHDERVSPPSHIAGGRSCRDRQRPVYDQSILSPPATSSNKRCSHSPSSFLNISPTESIISTNQPTPAKCPTKPLQRPTPVRRDLSRLNYPTTV